MNGVKRNLSISSSKYVDIVASFQTSYYISGIAPYGDALVVLAYIPEEENGEKSFSSTAPSRQVIIIDLNVLCHCLELEWCSVYVFS